MRIEFAPAEVNVAHRLVWRLITQYGFAPVDQQGTLSMLIPRALGPEFRIKFRVDAAGEATLMALNKRAESWLPSIWASAQKEWRSTAAGRPESVEACRNCSAFTMQQ
jgi:hypothetical protein